MNVISRQERVAVPAQRRMGNNHLDRADIVIIGNGIAGQTAAVDARRLAPDKRIVIITEQIHPTINTPALKQFAIGKLTQEQLLAYPAGTERAERIHVVTARVEGINAQDKFVYLDGDRGFGYDSLLIATGSAPTGLPAAIPGCDFDGVLTLHRLQDYLDLRRRLGEVSEAVVVGGGAHAIETVMSLLHLGITVHWLIRSESFLPRILDKAASDIVLARMKGGRHGGVRVHTETELVGIVGRVGSVVGVITNHQELIPCQLVLICTGTQPVTTLAERCTLPIQHERGILVDDQLCTSVRDIYAAGDVAALKNPLTGAYETRAQWYAAVSQGRTAAAVMTGHDELARQPFGVQWHATQLGDLSMLTVGNSLGCADGTTTLTDTSHGGYRRMAILDDCLVGYLSLSPVQPDSLAMKRLIDEGHSVRDITKALLKGNFDARKYFSRKRSHAMHGLLKTGKLPALAPAHNPVSHVQLLPITGPLAAAQVSVQTDALCSVQHQDAPGEKMRDTDPLHSTPQAVPGKSHTLPVLYKEDEEISPFTGNLPAIAGRIVESTLVPIPTEEWRSVSQKLWAYGDRADRADRVAEQEREREESEYALQTRRPSRSLWAYSRENQAGQ